MPIVDLGTGPGTPDGDSLYEAFDKLNAHLGPAAAQPSSGAYEAGRFVRNASPSVVSGRVLTGWFRLTTGSAHVADVDWAAVYARAESDVLLLEDGTPLLLDDGSAVLAPGPGQIARLPAAAAPDGTERLLVEQGTSPRRIALSGLAAWLLSTPEFAEASQDVVGAMVAAAGGSYNDGTNAITLPSGGGGSYTLPVATATALGGVKDGAGVSIAGDGALSVEYGTQSGTAAQGNDARITGAAQKSANLQDLTDADAALANLGGTPAGVGLFTAADAAAQRTLLGVSAGGGSGGATNLDALTDVALSSPAVHDGLRYSGSQWENKAQDPGLLGVGTLGDNIGAAPAYVIGSVGTLNPTSGVVYFCHVPLRHRFGVRRVSLRVGSAYTGGTSSVLGALYRFDANGRPAARIADFGQVGTLAATGNITSAQLASALGDLVGDFALAVLATFSGGTGTPGLANTGVNMGASPFGVSLGLGNGRSINVAATSTNNQTSLPADASALALIATGNTPLLCAFGA